jgi:hypothetical protein
MLIRLRRMVYRWLLRLLYRWLRRVGEWRERNELYITFLETGAALIGSVLFLREVRDLDSIGDFFKDAGPIECVILVILTLSLLSRAALLLRLRGLGPSFAGLANEQDVALLAELGEVRPGRPFLGHELRGTPDEARDVIKALAEESASTFSVRTFGEPDWWWAHWEGAYIAEWHALRPDAIWRIPSAADPEDGKAGYFSVMVPITNQSYSRYRRGHLHAALSTPDIDRRRVPVNSAGHDHVNLLAYSALYVPAGKPNEQWDRKLLLYTAIEHLSALISRRWTDLFQVAPTRGLRVICESSNVSLDSILEKLGFHAVYPEHDDPKESGDKPRVPKPLKSPAGFKLYELCYDPWIGAEDEANARGGRFLETLRQIAGQRAPANRRRGKAAEALRP